MSTYNEITKNIECLKYLDDMISTNANAQLVTLKIYLPTAEEDRELGKLLCICIESGLREYHSTLKQRIKQCSNQITAPPSQDPETDKEDK